jgi:hypothetical protein
MPTSTAQHNPAAIDKGPPGSPVPLLTVVWCVVGIVPVMPMGVEADTSWELTMTPCRIAPWSDKPCMAKSPARAASTAKRLCAGRRARRVRPAPDLDIELSLGGGSRESARAHLRSGRTPPRTWDTPCVAFWSLAAQVRPKASEFER